MLFLRSSMAYIPCMRSDIAIIFSFYFKCSILCQKKKRYKPKIKVDYSFSLEKLDKPKESEHVKM